MSIGICDDTIIEFTVLSTDIESSNDFLRWRIGVVLMVHSTVKQGDTRENGEYLFTLLGFVVSHGMGPMKFSMDISRKWLVGWDTSVPD